MVSPSFLFRRASTCFAIASNSRFAWFPGSSADRFVFSRVCGINDTSKYSSVSFEIVRLTPLIVIEPLSAKYWICSNGVLSRRIVWVFSSLFSKTSAVVSTWPWTRCPSNLSPSLIPASRFTSWVSFS